MGNQRSPLNFSKAEILLAVCVLVFTCISFYIRFLDIWRSSHLSLYLQMPFYIIRKYNIWIISLGVIFALSSISLLRGIQNQQIHGFSRFAHFAFVWPLILFPVVTFLWFFSYPCFIFGLIPPLLSMIESLESKKWLGSILAMIWIIGCTILASYYINVIDELVGW